MLGVLESGLPDHLKTGAYQIQRPISSSQQSYDTDQTKWPVSKPMPLFAAIMQVVYRVQNKMLGARWIDRRDAQGCLSVLPNPLLYYHVYIVIVTS